MSHDNEWGNGIGDDDMVRAIMSSLREDVTAPPSLRADVMRQVHAMRLSPWRRFVEWALRPRTLRLSPARAFAVAATAAFVLLVGSGLGPDEPVAQEAAPHTTRFVFIAPGASSVELTGDFVGWSPEAIRLRDELGTGVWTVDVPLEPGVYQYAFIVDGEDWRPDPRAVSRVDDGFGQENSVVIVSGAA